MKMFLKPNGRLTSKYGDSSGYRERVHQGIDFVDGFAKPQPALRKGLIYKEKNRKTTNLQRYKTLYQICNTPLGPMEVAYVHCWDFLVNMGDQVKAGQDIYLEGNTGDLVFSNGVKVTASEKSSGKGSHSHIGVRPMILVKKIRAGKRYMKAYGGDYYKANGYYYEIKYSENAGWVDYQPWLYTREYLTVAVQILKLLIKLKNAGIISGKYAKKVVKQIGF